MNLVCKLIKPKFRVVKLCVRMSLVMRKPCALINLAKRVNLEIAHTKCSMKCLNEHFIIFKLTRKGVCKVLVKNLDLIDEYEVRK